MILSHRNQEPPWFFNIFAQQPPPLKASPNKAHLVVPGLYAGNYGWDHAAYWGIAEAKAGVDLKEWYKTRTEAPAGRPHGGWRFPWCWVNSNELTVLPNPGNHI